VSTRYWPEALQSGSSVIPVNCPARGLTDAEAFTSITASASSSSRDHNGRSIPVSDRLQLPIKPNAASKNAPLVSPVSSRHSQCNYRRPSTNTITSMFTTVATAIPESTRYLLCNVPVVSRLSCTTNSNGICNALQFSYLQRMPVITGAHHKSSNHSRHPVQSKCEAIIITMSKKEEVVIFSSGSALRDTSRLQ
jgi:hypothetical protein